MRAFDESMRKLRREMLDLYLIHWPSPRVNRYVESWKALVRFQKDGGSAQSASRTSISTTSNGSLAKQASASSTRSSFIRVSATALRAFHDQRAIKTEFWSPLGRGGLLGEPAIVEIAAKH